MTGFLSGWPVPDYTIPAVLPGPPINSKCLLTGLNLFSDSIHSTHILGPTTNIVVQLFVKSRTLLSNYDSENLNCFLSDMVTNFK